VSGIDDMETFSKLGHINVTSKSWILSLRMSETDVGWDAKDDFSLENKEKRA
jgi:hypothetical protein